MNSEYVTYKGIPKCTIQKQLELQRMILDPDHRSYDYEGTGFKSHSASVKINDHKSVVQKQLELQQMVLGNV